MMASQSTEHLFPPPLIVLIGGLAGFVAFVATGGLLIFKTDMVADILRIPKSDEKLIITEPERFLHMGLVLIGVYVMIGALPELLQVAVQGIKGGSRSPSGYAAGQFYGSILRIGLATYVILFSRQVIAVINRYQR